MPVVGISVSVLNSFVGKDLPPEEMFEYLEQLGCDVDSLAEVTKYECLQCGYIMEKQAHEMEIAICPFCGLDFREFPDKLKKLDRDQVIKIDLLPVRPDMFDAGGLSRTLKGYLGIETGLPDYKVSKPKIKVKVSPELANESSYRPYIVCAAVRNFKFDHNSIKEIMTLQENLHWAVGRDRVKCSIGVYDLDRLVPDFEYKATDPEENSFVPLGNPLNRAMSPQEILESHPKGVKYAHIINMYDKYPLLVDKNNKVLSMPPIINNEDPKITMDSKNIFIDVTGPDKKVIKRALNILVASLVEYGGELEQVEIVYENGTDITPDITPFEAKIEPEYTRKLLGIDLDENEIASLLKKTMSLW